MPPRDITSCVVKEYASVSRKIPKQTEALNKVKERRDDHFARIVEEQDEKVSEEHSREAQGRPGSSSSHGREENEVESSKRRRFLSDIAEDSVEKLLRMMRRERS